VEAEQLSAGETVGPPMESGRPHHVTKVARSKKKQRTHVATRPRTAPDRSFAYFPQRTFPFDWRQYAPSVASRLTRHWIETPLCRSKLPKQPAEAFDLVVDAGPPQRVPDDRLVRRHHVDAKLLLQRIDRERGRPVRRRQQN